MKTRFLLLILAVFICNLVIGQNSNYHHATYESKPIIEMTLNGKKTWVLLDTGSDISILNIKAADEFGFSTYQRKGSILKVPGFGSSDNELFHARKAEMAFGETILRQHFYAFDMSSVVSSIENRTGKRISAIIGTNTMSNYGFIIDMRTKTVAMRTK